MSSNNDRKKKHAGRPTVSRVSTPYFLQIIDDIHRRSRTTPCFSIPPAACVPNLRETMPTRWSTRPINDCKKKHAGRHTVSRVCMPYFLQIIEDNCCNSQTIPNPLFPQRATTFARVTGGERRLSGIRGGRGGIRPGDDHRGLSGVRSPENDRR